MREKAKNKKEEKGEGRGKGRDSMDLFPQEKFPIATPMQNLMQLHSYTQKALASGAQRPPDPFPGPCP